MRFKYTFLCFFCFTILLWSESSLGNHPLVKKYCLECHNENKQKGDFDFSQLSLELNEENYSKWHKIVEQVKSFEMPPEDEIEMEENDRNKFIDLVGDKIDLYEMKYQSKLMDEPETRRLTLDEYENTLKDLFKIDHLGTNEPLQGILEDAYDHGFKHLSKNLIMSSYHLNTYMDSARRIIDDIIFNEKRPENINREFYPKDFKRDAYLRYEPNKYTKIISPEHKLKIVNFPYFSKSGYYRIKIKAYGVNRNYPYSEEDVGISKLDPIKLGVGLGSELKIVNLPDNQCEDEIVIETWVSKNTPVHFSFHTDGLRMQNNGNFKFNSTLTQEYKDWFKTKNRKSTHKSPKYYFRFWEGPHPRIEKVTIEGPFYKSWPPERETHLIGKNPKKEDIRNILLKFGKKAYRRPIKNNELDDIINYTTELSLEYPIKIALKEGLAAIICSVPFLYHFDREESNQYRFASKLSYTLWSSVPDNKLLKFAKEKDLDKKNVIEAQVRRMLSVNKINAFIENFPNAWFELNKLGFMPPEPKLFRYYSRKNLDEDMKGEVIHFFKHALENNISLLDFIDSNYSFLNQDLAHIYDIDGVKGSHFRKITFKDRRRGGVLGMGAILTLTADGFSTNPIHRGVWLKSNILGIKPTEPPADTMIEEPDLSLATNIRETLKAHTTQENCAVCHSKIDPYGWAFENYDPTGSWRSHYSMITKEIRDSIETKDTMIIDASSKIRGGQTYRDIIEFKELLLKKEQEIVKSFIHKLITYINGTETKGYHRDEIERLVHQSKSKGYKIVDTIIEVFKSPLIYDE